MYDAHSWVGVTVGLALYLMFFTGVVALFHHPIAGWEDPALHRPGPATEQAWVDGLLRVAPPDAKRIIITFPEPEEGLHGPSGYIEHPAGSFQEYNWVADAWSPRRSGAAEFLNHLHFLWHERAAWLMVVAGLISVALLVAITSGVVIHVRDLVAQWRQFRPARPPLVTWTDLHKVTGVLSLPFSYLMAYTGALIIFATALMGLVAAPVYGADDARIREIVTGPALPDPEPLVKGAVVRPVADWVAAGEAAVPGLDVMLVEQWVGSSRVRVGGSVAGQRGFIEAHLDGTSGRVLEAEDPDDRRPAEAATNLIYALHFGTAGGWGNKVVYALMALVAAASFISGNAMWLLRRRKKGLAGRGTAFLESCTYGVGTGLPLATALILLGTQVLPFDLEARVAVLELGFLGALVAAVVWASQANNRWRTAAHQMGLAALLFATLPFWRPGGLVGGGPVSLLAVELGWLTMSALCGFVSVRMHQRATSPTAERRAARAMKEAPSRG
ncbi:MAG: PepSY-associated TM helix domain-containing protein [Myxococcota bacterium]